MLWNRKKEYQLKNVIKGNWSDSTEAKELAILTWSCPCFNAWQVIQLLKSIHKWFVNEEKAVSCQVFPKTNNKKAMKGGKNCSPNSPQNLQENLDFLEEMGEVNISQM